MSPLAAGPILALLGIVAMYFVLRSKAKIRKSMYRTLREQREHDLRKRRDRATSARSATQAAAAAPAAAPGKRSSKAAIPAPDPVSEYVPPAPAYKPQAPAYTPPPPHPAAPNWAPADKAPVEQAPAPPAPPENLPEPPRSPGSRPAWEIVQPPKPAAEGVRGAGAAGAGTGRASWELDPREQQRINDRHKGRSRFGEAEEDDIGRETLPQILLSYAGLVAALLVILLGILFMIGARVPN